MCPAGEQGPDWWTEVPLGCASLVALEKAPWRLEEGSQFPPLLTHNANVVAKVDEVEFTIDFQMKKVPCLAVAVSQVKMTDVELCTSTWPSSSWCHCSGRMDRTSGPRTVRAP